MEQKSFGLEQNELQDKYLQARGLVIRLINGDENAAKDALNWLQNASDNHAEEKHHAGWHREIRRSSNITRISYYQNDEYPLVVEFKDRSKYAYDVRSVTYILPDKTQEVHTGKEIFEMLVQEDVDAVDGRIGPDGKMASVGRLFHHLIKRDDNKTEPIRYQKVQQCH